MSDDQFHDAVERADAVLASRGYEVDVEALPTEPRVTSVEARSDWGQTLLVQITAPVPREDYDRLMHNREPLTITVSPPPTVHELFGRAIKALTPDRIGELAEDIQKLRENGVPMDRIGTCLLTPLDGRVSWVVEESPAREDNGLEDAFPKA